MNKPVIDEMPEEGLEDLWKLQDIAMDLLARFPEFKVGIIDYLRATADMMEKGELDDAAQEQAKLYAYR